MNQERNDFDKLELDLKEPDSSFIFFKVWDRKEAHFHASFVNFSPNQFLAKENEFYYKPSKIYQLPTSCSPDFDIWLTYYGENLLILNGGYFYIELCLIINSYDVIM